MDQKTNLQTKEYQSVEEILQMIFKTALIEDASDIHIEPLAKGMRIRFRVDGIMREKFLGSANQLEQILNRLKVLSGLDITRHNVPQDGHFEITPDAESKETNIRISTFPTIYGDGETAVLRILDRVEMLFSIEELGMDKDALEAVERIMAKSYGMTLVTGPAGSGKTTLLYSLLKRQETKEKNIITLEDPVEFRFDEMRQTQMKPEQELTYASAMRSILRQDPDLIMVGEIRDPETAEYAVRAALTGKMIYSTIHSNSTIGTIERLAEMKVERSLIAYALNGVIAKRLVRTVCPYCKSEYQPAENYLKLFGLDKNARHTFIKGAGCDRCAQTGFQSRIGVFEVLELDDVIRSLIIEKAPPIKLQKYAESAHMKTLKQDALDKILTGITTIEEAIKVI
ncbi:type II/IV secretion system protein [Candidatus Falkowbacteria bacterium]|nr:type II/IV secretion system protein [Candidatus Falkowbacteria bacterium]